MFKCRLFGRVEGQVEQNSLVCDNIVQHQNYNNIFDRTLLHAFHQSVTRLPYFKIIDSIKPSN